MTLQEFSDNFDTLLNSHSARQGYGQQDALALDEYEKSVFLTKAQEQLVLTYYTGRNGTQESFEATEELRRYLAMLVREADLKAITNSTGQPLGMSTSSAFFTLPDDLWFITYEAATVSSDDCHDGTTLDVVPVTQDEYHRIKRNPYRGANGRRALRLDLADNVVEIVCKYDIGDYYVRYLCQCDPIILVDLPDKLSIRGRSTATDCQLHEMLHERILELAVTMALNSKSVTGSTK